MSGITTHVLDIARGRPAKGVPVTLSVRDGDGWRELATRRTDADGRARDLLHDDAALKAGTYRLRFAVQEYLAASGADGFYPWADVVFTIHDPGQHYHVPLLLSPFGYSTYRGS